MQRACQAHRFRAESPEHATGRGRQTRRQVLPHSVTTTATGKNAARWARAAGSPTARARPAATTRLARRLLSSPDHPLERAKGGDRVSLESRIAGMDALATRFSVARRPHPLLLVHRIDAELDRRLRSAAALYIARCLPGRQTFGPDDEDALLAALVAEADDVPNLTPNGMLVPKRHTVLEYNLLVRAIADVVSALGIADRIQSWHVPANLRVKFPEASEENQRCEIVRRPDLEIHRRHRWHEGHLGHPVERWRAPSSTAFHVSQPAYQFPPDRPSEEISNGRWS